MVPVERTTIADPAQRCRSRDYALLVLICLVLFGYSLVGARPLTMHEGIVPESACEMLADGDWAIPKSGGRPWLERPPLPQWITAGIAAAVGTCADEWVVRLPSVLLATGVVLLVARMGSIWFNRTVGLLSGLLLATMFEFTRYAWLAEPDIVLCVIVTAAIGVFVELEFGSSAVKGEPGSWWGPRPPMVVLFFALLGMTNLAKGLLFGAMVTVIPLIGFLLWNADRHRTARYLWGWGWLLFLVIGGAWPMAAALRYPDVLDLWSLQLGGRVSGVWTDVNEPLWYYGAALSWATQPWTIAAVIGLAAAWRRARDVPHSPERFLWCWAVLPVVVLSLPSGKHHHYLLHSLAPWAVSGSLGLVWLHDRIMTSPAWRRAAVAGWGVAGAAGSLVLWGLRYRMPVPGWLSWTLLLGWLAVAGGTMLAIGRTNGGAAIAIVLGAIIVGYAVGYTYAAPLTDQTTADTTFLRQVAPTVQPGMPVLVNMDIGSLDTFRILFYLRRLRDRVRPLHNLTYLVDDRIQEETVYLVSRQKDFPALARYGTADIVLQSEHTRRETSPEDRLTLFRLRFRPDVPRERAPEQISAMDTFRQAGPYLPVPEAPW
jgi:4-amino-4-deoxy-L-arabinose transferase-like glycosyltransferase